MQPVSQIDPNFKSQRCIQLPDVKFYDLQEHAHLLFGLSRDAQGYYRMPEAKASKVSEKVLALCRHSSGGRVRFVTDSAYVAIRVKSPQRPIPTHISRIGCAGFDLYRNGVFCGIFAPPEGNATCYESVIHFPETGKGEFTLHFPLYTQVELLEIGIQDGAVLEEAPPLPIQKTVVFYGSSITQGACVSRPGLSYVNTLARQLGCEILNLGFSGSALGETAMAEYIAALKPDVFVLDYEHNAPTVAHLQNTHYAFYRTFRRLCPDTPVLMLSSADLPFKRASRTKRRQVILSTLEQGKREGDQKLFFLDGETFYPQAFWDSCSVDTLHPNDIGHLFMAEAICPTLSTLLKKTAF